MDGPSYAVRSTSVATQASTDANIRPPMAPNRSADFIGISISTRVGSDVHRSDMGNAAPCLVASVISLSLALFGGLIASARLAAVHFYP